MHIFVNAFGANYFPIFAEAMIKSKFQQLFNCNLIPCCYQNRKILVQLCTITKSKLNIQSIKNSTAPYSSPEPANPLCYFCADMQRL